MLLSIGKTTEREEKNRTKYTKTGIQLLDILTGELQHRIADACIAQEGIVQAFLLCRGGRLLCVKNQSYDRMRDCLTAPINAI